MEARLELGRQTHPAQAPVDGSGAVAFPKGDTDSEGTRLPKIVRSPPRRWRDHRTHSGRSPGEEFIDSLSDADAAAVLAGMADVRERGLIARVRASLGKDLEMSAKSGHLGPLTGRSRSVGFGPVALWVVEGVSVVVELPVRGQEPGLEIGQAVCCCFAQHAGWVLE